MIRRAVSGVGRMLRVAWRLAVVTWLAYIASLYFFGPPYSLHPLCTYTVNAKVTAEVEYEGQRYSGSAIFQNARSRDWISIMNSAGCPQPYGNAIAFEVDHGQALLVPTRLCHDAAEARREEGQVDVLAHCAFENARQTYSVLIDSATVPRRWTNLRRDEAVRFISMTAVPTWDDPADNLDQVVPALAEVAFEVGEPPRDRNLHQMFDFRRAEYFRAPGNPKFVVSYDDTLGR